MNDSWLIFIFCLFIVKIFKKSIMILISFHLVLWVLLYPHPINLGVFYFAMFSLSIFFKQLPVKLLFARIWEINLIFWWKSIRAHHMVLSRWHIWSTVYLLFIWLWFLFHTMIRSENSVQFLILDMLWIFMIMMFLSEYS